MFTVDFCMPTRTVFGAGRLEELAVCQLPGRKALICVTADGLMEKLGLLDRVTGLLARNNVEYALYDQVHPNPTRASVMAAAECAREHGCDFLIGLGGGSSIDTAKATAIMMRNPGDLWDYAGVGTGGRKEILDTAPVVTVTTTSGTGTENDPYCVITNEKTGEKIDFMHERLFPAISIVDPELMVSLPRQLTLYQGFDALFHAAECFIANEHENKLIDLLARESVELVAKWLPVAAEDGANLEARANMAYAADVLCGYLESMSYVTSHHMIGQTLGGLYPNVAHGLSLLFMAEAYYEKIKPLRPELLDQLGSFMGVPPDSRRSGEGFGRALAGLLEQTGMRGLAMSEYGVKEEDFQKIAEITVDVVGLDFEKFTVTKEDIVEVLKDSYR